MAFGLRRCRRVPICFNASYTLRFYCGIFFLLDFRFGDKSKYSRIWGSPSQNYSWTELKRFLSVRDKDSRAPTSVAVTL